MGDNDYDNVDNWRPILLRHPSTGEYVRDPWVSWWEHRGRGSLGGVDCAALVGTPIHAPANCTIRNISLENGGSGGRTIVATYNTGWKDYFMHCDDFVSEGGYQKGMTIGYTGNTVAPGYPRVAQHLHWHRVDPSGYYSDPYGNTNRRNPWSYFTASGGAGGPITEVENIPMPALIVHPNDSVGFVSDAGELDVISDINEVNAILATGIVTKLIPTTAYIWSLLVTRTQRQRSTIGGGFVKRGDGSIGYVSADGTMDIIGNINELQALMNSGVASKIVPVNDSTWSLMVSRSTRLGA